MRYILPALPAVIFFILILVMAYNVGAAPAPKAELDVWCNDKIGVLCFISATEDISCLPLKDTKVKTCKETK